MSVRQALPSSAQRATGTTQRQDDRNLTRGGIWSVWSYVPTHKDWAAYTYTTALPL